MKVIVAGSRVITDSQFVIDAIISSGYEVSEVFCGGARGVDKIGAEIAKGIGIPVRHFPADWNLHGKSAGMIRNREMAEQADALIAVWDGQSRGTAHMISVMRDLGKPCHVVRPGETAF